MPFPRAHYFLMALLALTVLAFWPGYFSVLARAPLAFHIHGVTATLWILLLAAQSWSIHSGHSRLHRMMGRTALVLIPGFILGSLLVIWTFRPESGPLQALFALRLNAVDVLALAGFAWLTFMALKTRGEVARHARFMMATPLLLLAPVFTRLLLAFAPPLAIRGPDDFHHFAQAYHMSQGATVIIALLLFASAPRFGLPFLAVAGLALAQSLVFETVGASTWWSGLHQAYAALPMGVVATAGLVAGGAVAYLGWTAGSRR